MKQKTRTNQPVYPEVEFPVTIEVSNIRQLTDAQINGLQAGDIVAKKTGNQYHSYVVSYKENGQGICLTYTDASCVETVSYDLVGGHWVYNSTDITPIAEPLLENIVDEQGRKRFVEGAGSPLAQEGVTINYCKWSLSGTHLMLVVAGNIANGTSIANGTDLATFSLPKWIYDKIYPVWEARLEIKSVPLTANDWSVQTWGIVLTKSLNLIKFTATSAITLTADRGFRVSFDLLIDNE